MPATYEPIATTTLSSTQATVTFSSIPGTFTDIILQVTATSDRAAASEVAKVLVNSDTGSNYSRTILYGTGSTASSARSSNQSRFEVGGVGGNTGTLGNDFFQLQFLYYSNSTTNKTGLVRQTMPGEEVTAVVLLWRSTSAITRIDISPLYGTNWKANSIFTLYGIKAA